jgi:hypothetical protein
LKQRMSHDLDFMVNYTWGAEIDDNGTFRNGYLSNRVERSRGVADVPSVLNATAIWKLPFGSGQPLSSNNRIVRALISNYLLSGIYTYSSGVPLAIISSGCVSPGSGQCMPNYTPGYSGNARIGGGYGSGINAVTAATTHYIDINAFVNPAQYTIGNLGRTRPYGLRGPTAFDGDLSLKRTVVLHDNLSLLLDISAYNITNSFIPTAPGVSISTPSTFGVVSGQSNASRDIQIAARINF